MSTKPPRKRRNPLLALLSFFGSLIGTVLILLLLIFVGVFAANVATIGSTYNNMWQPDALNGLQADYIVVLGAGLDRDGSPSPMLEERLNTGIALYQKGASKKLLMSGGSDRMYYNEAQRMKDYAIEKGVPKDAILTDDEGRNTYASVAHAYDTYGAENIVLVSQRYHLYRAVFIAEHLGMEAYGVPSDTRDWPGQEPREFFARVKDFAICQLPKLPDPVKDTLMPLITRLGTAFELS